jgi:thiamine biosynthesis protein ThiI
LHDSLHDGLHDGGAQARIKRSDGRLYLMCPDEKADAARAALAHLAGITGWAEAAACEKTLPSILDLCVSYAVEAASKGKKTFKVEARRSDKSFPVKSMELCRKAGDFVLDAVPQLRVDVHEPEFTIKVEIRDKAYVYGDEKRGLRGLPVGSAGHGMLLLSGGIDSPVAGYLMALRGMRLAAVYFHSYPYTSREAGDKAAALAKSLGEYSLGIKLYSVNLTAVQERIKERAPEAWATVLLRMVMLVCAQRLARREKCRCLITGESLSQVASQTVENIACTQSALDMPVLRPLIGMDKEDIIARAKALGTYETSILPYEDCCALFAPRHPVIYGKTEQAAALYDQCGFDGLIAAALTDMTLTRFGLNESMPVEEWGGSRVGG